MKKSTSLRSLPIYESNPYTDDLNQKIRIKRRKEKEGTSNELIVVSRNTGEDMESSVNICSYQEYEPEIFIKVFVKNIKLFFELNTPATRVLMYVFRKLEVGKDFILFDMTEATKFTAYKSDVSVREGLETLIRSKLLARSQKSYIYYINPLVFFNGNRVSFIKQLRKKKLEKTPAELKQDELFGEEAREWGKQKRLEKENPLDVSSPEDSLKKQIPETDELDNSEKN
jgi:hypothetical protein